MSQSNSDEIDLGVVFSKIKESFNSFLISIYFGIQFVFRNWWKIILVALFGAISGYLINLNQNPPKTTTLIIQNNFNSSSYVYNAVEQLNNKLTEKDTTYLKNLGFNVEDIVLKKLEIEPIVNIVEIMDKTMFNYRTLEPLLEKADFEDDLLTSEVFIPEYKFHKLTIITSNKGENQSIQNVVNYLNNNDKFNDIKAVVYEESIKHIQEYENTIVAIDDILASYSFKDSEKADSQQIFISTGSRLTDLGDLVNSKLSILNQKERLKTEMVKYNNIVTVMNKPYLQEIPRIISLNMKSSAIIFVFLYFLASFLKSKYLKIKNMAEAKNS